MFYSQIKRNLIGYFVLLESMSFFMGWGSNSLTISFKRPLLFR